MISQSSRQCNAQNTTLWGLADGYVQNATIHARFCNSSPWDGGVCVTTLRTGGFEATQVKVLLTMLKGSPTGNWQAVIRVLPRAPVTSYGRRYPLYSVEVGKLKFCVTIPADVGHSQESLCKRRGWDYFRSHRMCRRQQEMSSQLEMFCLQHHLDVCSLSAFSLTDFSPP